MTTRRDFVLKLLPTVAVGAGTGLATLQAHAAPVPVHAAETDTVAAQLGYRHDATKVDKKKYPTWAAGHICGNCLLYQGKATDAWAVCAVFGGKAVNAKGWCQAWVKKA